MTKKQIKWLLLSLVFVAVCGAGLYLYQRYEAAKYTGYEFYTGKGKIDSYQVLADGKSVIVHWDVDKSEENILKKYNDYLVTEWPNPIAQNYVMRENRKLPQSPIHIGEPVGKDGYWTLSLYKVEGDKLREEPEIDLLSLVDDYKEGYISNSIGPVYSYQGKDLLTLRIRPLQGYYEETEKVFLNLETRKIEEIPSLEEIDFPKTAKSFGNFSHFGIKDDVRETSLTIQTKQLKDAPIQEDRAAKALLADHKNTQVVFLTNANSFDDIERRASVYSLFVPKDYNLYKELTVPAELSTDGQEHRVNSKVEFDRYYDIEKAKKIYHLE